jgi:hypothetical protein
MPFRIEKYSTTIRRAQHHRRTGQLLERVDADIIAIVLGNEWATACQPTR